MRGQVKKTLCMMYDKYFVINFGLHSIKHGLRKVACEAGLEHRGWYNPGSTWFVSFIQV